MSFGLAMLLLSFSWSVQAAPERPQTPTPWYERVLDRINPDDTDYGSIWEERKRAFLDNYVRDPYFQYSFWTTAGLMFSLLIHFVQHVSHQRALDVAARSISNLHRHDQYARRVAREAIRRYNDHIEQCNRVIEASAAGGQWVSSADLESLKLELKNQRGEVAALREENKRLREDNTKGKPGGGKSGSPSQGQAETDASAESDSKSPAENDTNTAHYIALINQLQEELIAERRKNKQLKGTSV